MSKINSNPTMVKKISFILIATIISLIIFGALVVGYFTYKKLTLSYDYCQSFGKIDSKIGWVLEKDIDSCLSLKNKINGEVYFDTKIHTDSNGFRTDKRGDTPPSSILAIGDSWTFGYGVDGDETYPYFLSKLLGEPVHNSGVPAYGSASTYLYAKSNIEKLKPKTVIYLTIGLWRRSVCLKKWDGYESKGGLHNEQLIPCYLIDQSNYKAKLLKPLPGIVEASVKDHIYPGGSLTAGYDSFLEYVFFTKPKLVIQDIKERLGISSMKNSTGLENYYIKKYELNSFLELAEEYDFQFVLVDPSNEYKKIITNKDIVSVQNLIYIDHADWEQYVIKKSQGMPASDLSVPMDGHFGKGINRLIANLIQQKIFAKKANLEN